MARMVIIGAGECGTRAALALREAGFGGPVTLIGAETARAVRAAAAFQGRDHRRHAASQGDRRLGAAGRGRHRLPALGAPSLGIDRTARHVLLDGETIAYERLLLATGARPRPLPLPGADGPTVATLRTLDDAARIRAALGPGKRLAVIGGGFIGLELAASARKLGSEVTVVEVLPRLLTRGVPAEVAKVLYERHIAEGVSFHFGAQIAKLTDAGVVLADDTTIRADLVVVGIGAMPNTELAVAAGLAVDNGIAVDATLATSDPASSPPATAARSCSRCTIIAGCASRAGAAHRSRGRSRRATCWARPSQFRACRGSGPTSTTSRCRSPVSPRGPTSTSAAS